MNQPRILLAFAMVSAFGLLLPAFAEKPAMTPKRTDVKPFEYMEARVPFYPAGGPWGRTGEPLRQMQKPLAAAESIKHFVTPVGFDVQLFAAEPDIGKPICMNWDERGRLWLAETVDYPNEKQPEGHGHDRIRICEDTDGDGRADKFTVFADKLSLPTSLTFHHGGVIVTQPPQTLFLKDTNGDDVADVRQVLFSGWSTADTHAGPSNLQYGLDNWIYGMVGYAGFFGTIAGERHSFRQGFFRFKMKAGAERAEEAAVAKCEFLRNTNNNSWGVGFSEEGVLFGSTANGNPSVHLPIPNRYYEAVRGWSSSVLTGIAGDPRFEPITDKVRQVDYHGRFTAGAGHALYTARAYPKEYWNRTAFVCEPTGHLVATFEVTPRGGSYRSEVGWNLLASDDEWSAPIMAEVGPDGNVWVIDWCNYIVQHNPTPAGFRTGKGAAYETELRDKKHGRIYRIVFRGNLSPTPSPKRGGEHTSPPSLSGKGAGGLGFSLADARPEKLVATLKNDNFFWRRHAQRLLVERGQIDVVPALIQLAKDASVDEIGLNAGVIHALWTLHGLGALDGSNAEATAVAVAELKHKSAGVRRNALQVLPPRTESIEGIVDADLLRDPDPQVRLAALLALADQRPSLLGSHAVLKALTDENVLRDRWLTDAATSAAAANGVGFLKAIAWLGHSEPATQPLLGIVERVAEHVGRGAPGDEIGPVLATLVDASPSIAAATIAGLARGWPKDRPAQLDAATEKALADLLKKLPTASRGQLVLLATRWGSKVLERHGKEIAAAFLAQAQDAKESDTNRVAAAGQLMDFRKSDSDTAKVLLEQITPQTSPELGQGLLEALGRSEAADVGSLLVERLPTLTPSLQPAALRVLLGRSEWTLALLDGVDRGNVPITALTLEQRQTLANHPSRRIAERAKRLLARGGSLPNPDRQKVLDELMPLTMQKGDPAAGKLVFKNQCLKCHTHNGEGTKIGPDLSGMAVHPKQELLLQIIDPSRSVEGNYRQYIVATKAGQVLSGLLASETKTTVELFDSEGKKHVLQRDDIEELQASAKSLMPDGFEKLVSAAELTNLLEFLAQRGKYVPLPLDRVANIVTTRGMFNSEQSMAERLIFRDWSPKTVGEVPFVLVDPQGDRTPNAVMLNGPQGTIPPRMPKSVRLACQSPAKAIHLLSGVSGWGFPATETGTVSLIVRLHYADGKSEDHELKNGEHFADYIRRVDVPGSQFAFSLRGQQLRYLSIQPKRGEKIAEIEFVKGPDRTAPVVMAVTLEMREE